jgi:hypothetical protein
MFSNPADDINNGENSARVTRGREESGCKII